MSKGGQYAFFTDNIAIVQYWVEFKGTNYLFTPLFLLILIEIFGQKYYFSKPNEFQGVQLPITGHIN